MSAWAAAYVAERRDRMRYDDYLRRGLPVGSGRVEAACKTVVGRRMKCTGMRWTVAVANPVLWLRAPASAAGSKTAGTNDSPPDIPPSNH